MKSLVDSVHLTRLQLRTYDLGRRNSQWLQPQWPPQWGGTPTMTSCSFCLYQLQTRNRKSWGTRAHQYNLAEVVRGQELPQPPKYRQVLLSCQRRFFLSVTGRCSLRLHRVKNSDAIPRLRAVSASQIHSPLSHDGRTLFTYSSVRS